VDEPGERDWQVLLLGGASGTGRASSAIRWPGDTGCRSSRWTTWSSPVQRMTSTDQQLMLHYWETHPDAGSLPVSHVLELEIAPRRCGRRWTR
jgi:hypothetical protein